MEIIKAIHLIQCRSFQMRGYGHGRGRAHVKVEWDSVQVHEGQQAEEDKVGRHTIEHSSRLLVHLLYYPLK